MGQLSVPATIRIGSTITGATANRVLFVGAGPVLADSNDLQWGDATKVLLLNGDPSSVNLAGIGTFSRGGNNVTVGSLNAAGTLNLMAGALVRWSVFATGLLAPQANNTYDIGFSGALMPKSLFLGTSLQIEANNGLKLINQTNGAAAGAGTLGNAPAAGNPTFWMPITVNGANKHIPCW